MKPKLLAAVLLFFFIAAPAVTRAADEMPKQATFARYEAMTNHSPFAVATAVVPPPVAPNFAKDLYIANAARLEDEGVVTLSSSADKNMKEYLSTKEPNPHGYKILNIEWSDRVGSTKVTIEKDGQSAELTFNQALVSQPVAGIQSQPPPPQPQAPMQPAAQGAPYACQPDQARADTDAAYPATSGAWGDPAQPGPNKRAVGQGAAVSCPSRGPGGPGDPGAN